MNKNLSAFICGLIFASGLGISKMTDPYKILGFLNLFGKWDPTLLVVFISALATYFVGFRWLIDRETAKMFPPTLLRRELIEPRVVIGSLMFGIGWGMMGLCPGPSIVDLATGKNSIFLFVVSMLFGMLCVKIANRTALKN